LVSHTSESGAINRTILHSSTHNPNANTLYTLVLLVPKLQLHQQLIKKHMQQFYQHKTVMSTQHFNKQQSNQHTKVSQVNRRMKH